MSETIQVKQKNCMQLFAQLICNLDTKDMELRGNVAVRTGRVSAAPVRLSVGANGANAKARRKAEVRVALGNGILRPFGTRLKDGGFPVR